MESLEILWDVNTPYMKNQPNSHPYPLLPFQYHTQVRKTNRRIQPPKPQDDPAGDSSLPALC